MTIIGNLQGGMLVRLRLLASVFDVAIAADCEPIGDAKLVEHDYLLKNGRKKCPRMGTVGFADWNFWLLTTGRDCC
jgi:hypothetical protein